MDNVNKTPAAPAAASPSLEERIALVRASQAESMQRPNPQARSLGVLTGDVAAVAHYHGAEVQAALDARPATFEERERLARRQADLQYSVRNVERLMRLERSLAQATEDSARQS